MHIEQVVQQLRAHLASTGMTESRLARACGLPQSTAHQALRSPKRITSTHRKMCAMVGLPCPEPATIGSKRTLLNAVLDVWDGSERHAQQLVGLLRTAGAAQAGHTTKSSRQGARASTKARPA